MMAAKTATKTASANVLLSSPESTHLDTMGMLLESPLSSDIFASASPTTSAPLPFYIDSGATSHCSPTRCDFVEYTEIAPRSISGINGSPILAIGRGSVNIFCGPGCCLVLRNVLYIPQASLRLISIGRLCDNGLSTTFNGNVCTIRDKSGQVLANANRSGLGLFTLHSLAPPTDHAFISRPMPNLITWHRRLGHTNYDTVAKMAKLASATGMHIPPSPSPPICEHCVLGKQTKTPVQKTRGGGHADEKLGLVFSDITGPEHVLTKSGE